MEYNQITKEEIIRLRLIDLYHLPPSATHHDILIEAERRFKEYEELIRDKLNYSNRKSTLAAYTN